ncbi:MAG TPA: hypothetical protein VEZ11_15205 [Thermoanaerobaculia bacterium]|nr:hypothetical protein [Thermoanaerobaculia bacterium]
MTILRSRLILFSFLLGFGLVLLNVPTASAIPAFARKYETSCQTCHVGFPKLNPFGEAFRLNGYRMPKETEDQVKIKPVSLGSDAYKRLWPRAIYPSDIPGHLPVALNVKFASVYASTLDDTGRTVTKNDFQFPQEVNLFAGGTFGDHMSYLVEVTHSERPDGGSDTEIEHAQLHLNSIWGPEHLVNVKIGKFAPDFADGFQEMWLSTNNGIDTLFSYDPVGLHGGNSLDGGGISLPANVRAIEVYGVSHHRLFYTLGITNGIGPGASGSFNAHANKDVYARVDYKLGGMGLDGDTTGVKLPPENWRERSLRVGVLGYAGDGKGFNMPFTDDTGAQVNIQDRTFTRGGLYASWIFEDLNVFAVALSGRDRLDTFAADGTRTNTASYRYNSWFVQADYVFLPPLQGSLRYENLKPGDKSVGSMRALNASLAFFAYANVKTILEYHRDLHNTKNYEVDTVLRVAF